MRYITLILLIIITIQNSFGQKLEISGGLNINRYFDLHKDGGHFSSDYTVDYGYSIGISYYDLKIDTNLMGMSLRFDNYKGDLKTSNGLSGGSYNTSATVEKQTIGFGFYPINSYILKKLRLNLGAEINIKIKDKTSGSKSSWNVGGNFSNMTIENDSVRINKKIFWGLTGVIGYDFKIADQLYISPHYKFYFGMSDEFKNTEARIKSMRHNFEIGIIKKIKAAPNKG